MLIIKIHTLNSDSYFEIVCNPTDLGVVTYILETSTYVKFYKVCLAGDSLPKNGYYCAKSVKWVERWEWEL